MSLKAALFDINGHNFAFRASFNRRSWVTRLSKIFQKVTECVFLTYKSNLAIFIGKKYQPSKPREKTVIFRFFYLVDHVVILFFIFFFIKRYIYKFPTSLLKKDTVALFILEKIDFFSSKKMPP